MFRRILLGIALGIAIVVGGLFLWAQSVLGQDTVRAAVEAQLTRAVGHPVTIGGIRATIFPRVTVTLTDVAVGQPASLHANELHIGTGLRALISRRVEHAEIRLTGARIAWPLPPFSVGSAAAPPDGAGSASSGRALEIVSIDDIRFDAAELTSGGRTVRADASLVPNGNGFDIRRLRLVADGETVSVTGRITDLSGPTGQLSVTGSSLSFDRLILFAMDFARGATAPAAGDDAVGRTARTAPKPVTVPGGHEAVISPTGVMDMTIGLEAERATFGTLVLTGLSGQARVTSAMMTVSPVRFGVFDGHYDGALTLTLDPQPAFRLRAEVTGVNTGSILAFLGGGDPISGTLAATLDVSGRGLTAAAVRRTARGTARLTLADGVIKRLGLVRSVVLATSMRAGSRERATAESATTDEPFSALGATFELGDGGARTDDLILESQDLRVSAKGAIALDGSAIDLAGLAQLSETLSKQAGRDLVRYTQTDGRVTVPVLIRGSASAPRVSIDLGDLTKRALINRATEEVTDALRSVLGR